MSRSVRRSRPLVAALSILGLLTLASPLVAQELPENPEPPLAPLDTTPPPPNNPPYVEFLPSTGTFGSTSLAVSIEWCDDTGLNHTSREIKLNGVNVTSQFTYTTPGFSEPCPGWAHVRRSQATVTLNVGANSMSGKICDTASQCTTQNVTYTVTSQVAPLVALKNYNPDNLDRSQCLVSGAGEAAAYQCGDLLVSHAMPGYQTKGRDRSLTLVYSSATAAPRAVVAAEITTPTSGIKPDTVFAALLENGTPKASAKFQSWNVGETRQIVLAFSMSGNATGVYNLTLKVENRYNGFTPMETVVPLQVLIVNRSAGEFGGGWWPAGVEQLVLGQPGGILWVGGDGSAKLYAPFGANTWRAPAGAFRDSLVLSSGVYTRKLKHGIQVRFDAAGRHIQTVNRLGDTTYLNWTGSPAVLTSIKVPPSSAASGITYTLAYASGKLDKITDPAGRILDATVSSNVLTNLKDPDNKSVVFTYDSSKRMLSRTTRRGFVAQYQFTGDLRLTKADVPIGTVSTPATASTVFQPWDHKGLVVGLAGSSVKQAAKTDTVYTKILGPRVGVADDAIFWIDKWGAPSKIQDPLGRLTTITRDSTSSTPALPTAVAFPDNRIATMTWNGRGNLLSESIAASGSPTATTTYAYIDSLKVPDSPTSITDPTGVVTSFTYDTILGLTRRVATPNGATGTHKTGFEYHPKTAAANLRGLLKSVADSSVAVYDTTSKTTPTKHPKTRFAYDAWGNVVADTSPMNHVRTFTRDGMRRVSDLYDPENHRTRFVYDSLNRVKETIQYVEAGAQLKTRTVFATDVVDSIVDPRSVYRRFQYDAAGRQIAEIDELGKQTTRTYDAGGLLLTEKTRAMQGTSDVISYTYDAVGRLLTKTWPAVNDTLVVPYGPGAGFPVSVVIPGNTVTYDYDDGDRLESAITSDYKVTRTYHANGLLKQEVQSKADGSEKFTNQYDYDAAGRRTQYRIGTGTGLVDTVTYLYPLPSKELSEIEVRWRGSTRRDTVKYVWDGLGRRKQLTYSKASGVLAPIVVKFAYDGDGTLRRICSTHGGSVTPLQHDAFRMRIGMDTMDKDGLLKVLNTGQEGATGDLECPNYNTLQTIAQTRSTFDMRHQLIRQVNVDSLSYAYDGSGNMLKKMKHIPNSGMPATDSLRFIMRAASSRMDTLWHFGDRSWVRYDADGARTRIRNLAGSGVLDWRAYWYDALGRFSGEAHHVCDPFGYVVPGAQCEANERVTLLSNPNACRYEALGRLLWPCADPQASGVKLGYDGDNVVRTGHDSHSFSWTFIQGPGIDDPLIGHHHNTANNDQKFVWYVTDGRGRQYALGDSTGLQVNTAAGGYLAQTQLAGGISNAHSFDAARNGGNTNLPGISFFRNRFYDQQTGRWLQEDPLGVSAGMNLYQYVGNNPASYTDPFGLLADTLKFEGGAGADFAQGFADLINCVLTCGPGDAGAAIEGVTTILEAASAPETITVRYGRVGHGGLGSSTAVGSGREIVLNPNHIAFTERYTLPSAVVHEAIEGYLFVKAGNPPSSNLSVYRSAHGTAVRIGEDPALLGAGIASRTSRSRSYLGGIYGPPIMY